MSLNQIVALLSLGFLVICLVYAIKLYKLIDSRALLWLLCSMVYIFGIRVIAVIQDFDIVEDFMLTRDYVVVFYLLLGLGLREIYYEIRDFYRRK
uniref:Uncharacterized protein n=1 Tax=viral metagenome TaxID=1070528 RepID=A0A6M3K212_9ZZZZ